MLQSNKDIEVQIKKLEAELQKLKKEDPNRKWFVLCVPSLFVDFFLI